MVRKAYLDTHIIVWLYAGNLENISDQAKKVIESFSLYYSPIVKLELEYLFEIKRLKEKPDPILSYLQGNIGLEVCNIPFTQIIHESLKHDFTRDPFDRIIVSQAAIHSDKLISRDKLINDYYGKCVY